VIHRGNKTYCYDRAGLKQWTDTFADRTTDPTDPLSNTLLTPGELKAIGFGRGPKIDVTITDPKTGKQWTYPLIRATTASQILKWMKAPPGSKLDDFIGEDIPGIANIYHYSQAVENTKYNVITPPYSHWENDDDGQWEDHRPLMDLAFDT